MLEQLNRTLELLQKDKSEYVYINETGESGPTVWQKAEQSVLGCIAILCTPLVAIESSLVDELKDRLLNDEIVD